MKAWVVSTFLAVFAFCSANAAETVKLAYIEFPPVTYTNDAGIADGLLVDLATEVLEHAGYRWQAQSFPAARMIEHLNDGTYHLWLGVNTLPGLRNTVLYSDSSIASVDLNIYGNGTVPNITAKEQLTGQKVAILRGYSYGGWISFIKDKTNEVRYIEVDDHEQALRLLRSNRVDLLLDYQRPVAAALEQLSFPELKFNLVSTLDLYFVVSKKAPDAEKLITDLEASFQALRQQR